MMEEKDFNKSVCIIGSGLSGLTCGMYLARAGFNVSVVEELTSPGGLLSYTRIGREYLELLPHHIRKSDKALISLSKEMGVEDNIVWAATKWSGLASSRSVGYFNGGFSCLISSLMQGITDNGGNILFSTTVAEISTLATADGSSGYRTSCILTNSTRYVLDSKYVIFTGSCRTFINVSHGLPIPMDFRDTVMNITYKAGITALMVLKQQKSVMFYQKAPAGMPFDSIINHSVAFTGRDYGGSVIYLKSQCSITDSIWIDSDASIMDKYFTAFRKLYPSVRKSDIKSWRLTKTRYALSTEYPQVDLTNPCENLYVCSAGLTRYGVTDTPKNHMDPVVALAIKISSDIIARAEAGNESESHSNGGPEVTNLTEYI